MITRDKHKESILINIGSKPDPSHPPLPTSMATGCFSKILRPSIPLLLMVNPLQKDTLELVDTAECVHFVNIYFVILYVGSRAPSSELR